MKFVLPCKEYEQKAVEYIREFYEYSSEINGTGGLDRYLKTSTYSEWLAKQMRETENVTYFYVCEDDEKLTGMVNIRFSLNDFMRKECGHIGYSIRPSERGKGYGTQLLEGALFICRMAGLKEVILTCNRDNTVSARIIKNCGGVLEEEFYSETFGEVIQRYMIRTEKEE